VSGRPGKRERAQRPREVVAAFALRAGEAHVELQQLLKATGGADSGGGAKVAIQAGEVRVNGQVERRRSRKLVAGDVVSSHGRSWRVEPTP
jgi:ribosome-associated protein